MTSEATAYDHVFYPGLAYEQTHPDRLATLAALFGMSPTPITNCRVLELGCGVGGNLLPMAYALPDSEFVGLDLSERTIAQGNANVKRLNLTNVQLLHRDIMTLTSDFGAFDYIIAHGVYSWVPPAVRGKILEIFRDHLTTHGVAYVSYNSYPGSHLRNLARDMMLYHVRDIADPRERVNQGRALMKFLSEAPNDYENYRLILKDQFERVMKMKDEVLYHDDLDEGSTPFYFHQVVADAARCELQFLSEADYADMSINNYPAEVVNVLRNIPASEVVAREQYLDFIKCRCFRQTLLCRREVRLEREKTRDRLRDMSFATPARPSAQSDATLKTKQVIEFVREKDASMSTDHQLSQVAFLYLGEMWPRAVHFDDLVRDALARLDNKGARASSFELSEEVDALCNVLSAAYAVGFIEAHLYPPRFAAQASARPQASLLARAGLQVANIYTNLCHKGVRIEDEITRSFLPLLDGTRDVEQLRAALGAIHGDAVPQSEITREQIEANLAHLAKLALLES